MKIENDRQIKRELQECDEITAELEKFAEDDKWNEAYRKLEDRLQRRLNVVGYLVWQLTK